MLIAEFSRRGEEIEIDDELWQYDYGQKIQIKGLDLPEVFEVHFAWKDIEKAKVVTGSTVDGVSTVDIPNIALEQRRMITAYIYLSDTTEGETVNTILLPVNRRKAPENFEAPEDVDLFHHTLAAAAEYQRRAKESEKNASTQAADSEAWAHGREDHPEQEQDNAKYYAEQAAASQQMVSDSATQAQNNIGEAQQQAIKTITEQQGISIQKIKNQTAESEDNLKNTIRAAEQIKTDLDTEVENATPIKQGLDDSNTAAGKTKTALDTSNTTATKTKADLDASNTTASETKTGLDATNKTAAGLVTSLGNKITEGTQVKTDIQTTGETAMSNLQAEATKQQEFIKTSIDDTLSISGKAADAAVTGKKIDSLKEDLSNKITKFYASNQGETHITDSDSGKIQDMVLYGKSEQKQYKGINLLPPDTNFKEYVEVSIPKGSLVFWVTDGILTNGGNFRFFNEDKTESMWFGIDSDTTSKRMSLTIDAKYVQNLISTDFDLSKICLGVGSKPIYEPYTGGIPSPSPDYPQKIKNVVNPTVKVCGKNLWNPTLGGYISGSDGSIKAAPKKSMAATDFIKTSGKDITVIARNFSSAMESAYAYRIGFYNAEKKWIKNIILSDGNKYSINTFNITGTEYIRVSAPSGIYDTIQIEKGSEATSYEPYTEQSVQLPYTLNAIPVTSGGNVTIDGQQYVSDRVVEKDGVFGIERNIREVHTNTKTMNNSEEYPGWNKVEGVSDTVYYSTQFTEDSRKVTHISNFTQLTFLQNNKGTNNILYCLKKVIGYSQSELIAKAIDVDMYIRLQNAIFEPLPGDIQVKLQTFVTNYPVTNISVTSDQLDGYTVFNYPISMANGWNYVKQQLNDNRDYIYDMDLQSAEAYVNSEYAVALTELEV